MTIQEQLTIVNKIAILEDVKHQYLMELPSDLRQALKFKMNQAMAATRNLIREFDRIHSSENSEAFGIEADEIRDLLDNYFKSQINILSHEHSQL